MALTLNDVLTLGKMGFTKTDIAALMGAQPGVSAHTTPAPVVQTNAPAAPDYGALVAGLAGLSEKVSALSVPSAGIVGNPAPVTSVEDIILGAYQPKQTSTDVPDFSKGVIK